MSHINDEDRANILQDIIDTENQRIATKRLSIVITPPRPEIEQIITELTTVPS